MSSSTIIAVVAIVAIVAIVGIIVGTPTDTSVKGFLRMRTGSRKGHP